MSQSNRPEFQVQIGHVQGSVWINESAKGARFYSTTINKAYQEQGVWKTTSNYNSGDLAALGVVSAACMRFLMEHPLDRYTRNGEADEEQRTF